MNNPIPLERLDADGLDYLEYLLNDGTTFDHDWHYQCGRLLAECRELTKERDYSRFQAKTLEKIAVDLKDKVRYHMASSDSKADELWKVRKDVERLTAQRDTLLSDEDQTAGATLPPRKDER